MNEKELQTASMLAKASAIYSLVRELSVSYAQWSKTHKNPMTEEDSNEFSYLISNAVNELDAVGRNAHEVQEERVNKLIKK